MIKTREVLDYKTIFNRIDNILKEDGPIQLLREYMITFKKSKNHKEIFTVLIATKAFKIFPMIATAREELREIAETLQQAA